MTLGVLQGPSGIDPSLLERARQISAWMQAADTADQHAATNDQQAATLEQGDTNAVTATEGTADTQGAVVVDPATSDAHPAAVSAPHSPQTAPVTPLPVPATTSADTATVATAPNAPQPRMTTIHRNQIASPPVMAAVAPVTPASAPASVPAADSALAVAGHVAEPDISAKTKAALAAMPGATWAGHLGSNGGREVAIVVPPGVDFSKPVELVTFFHGLNGSIADKVSNPQTNIKESMIQLAKGKNAVFVIPNGSPAGVAHTSPRNTSWMDPKSTPGATAKALQDDAVAMIRARWAPNLSIGSYTVAGHSGGGRPIANAASSGTLRADHIVLALRPSVLVEHTLAKLGATRFWELLHQESYVNALGAITGAQAVQMVKAGLKSIYLSGWQVAADGNQSGQTYPDQSLYPSNSVPAMVKRLNNALTRADQIHRLDDGAPIHWYAPIIADAEAGFGGPLHAFELMKAMIEAGASAVHFEDQLASEKKCGHLGGKVLVPTNQFIRTLVAARLAADVSGVPSVIIARTDAHAATLMTSDIDPYDAQFLTGDRTSEGFYRVREGLDPCIARGLAYAPYADVIWFETSTPNMAEAKRFAEAIHAKFPGKRLAYNCSPSFNWKKYLDDAAIATFQKDLGKLGYSFQFITLAGWHLNNFHSFDLADGYRQEGMTAYVRLQEQEFAGEARGYTAARHQREVGTGYFDQVLMAVTGGNSSTAALTDSTEAQQFQHS